MGSLVKARRHDSYKEKSLLAKQEADELITALADARLKSLEAAEMGESLQSLGDIASRVASDIASDNDMELPLFPVPSGGISTNDRYDRFEKQFYNLMLTVANLSHEHSELQKRYAGLLAKSALSTSELKGGEIYESRSKTFEEHVAAINDTIEESANTRSGTSSNDERALVPSTSTSLEEAKRRTR